MAFSAQGIIALEYDMNGPSTMPSPPVALAGNADVHDGQTATPAASVSPASPSAIAKDISSIEQVPADISQLPLLEQLSQVMPAADLFFGATMLIAIVLVHATGVRGVTSYVARRSMALLTHPKMWRADLLMSTTVFLLLALHIAEIFIWSASLFYSGIVADWRAAGFFAGNTYTTLGYGRFVLSGKWEMLAPIMAISGLFTFGWSGSVLVDLVARCQKIKDAANAGNGNS
jgi:Ion channel